MNSGLLRRMYDTKAWHLAPLILYGSRLYRVGVTLHVRDKGLNTVPWYLVPFLRRSARFDSGCP